ncbi:hypothetical protein [Pseudovibrio sp. Ad5]|nr:hypothetical protein [Pseudovibrio sp. Ad5]
MFVDGLEAGKRWPHPPHASFQQAEVLIILFCRFDLRDSFKGFALT